MSCRAASVTLGCLVAGLLAMAGCADESMDVCQVHLSQQTGFSADLTGHRVSVTPWALVDGALVPAKLEFTRSQPCSNGWVDVRATALPDAGAQLVQGLRLDVHIPAIPADAQWWSQGFQSWSQSGPLTLRDDFASAEDLKEMADIGDKEVMRSGAAASWWGTVVGRGDAGAFGLALSADRWKSWAEVRRAPDGGVDLRLWSGAQEAVPAQAGIAVPGELFRIYAGDQLTQALLAFGDALPRRKADPEAGWNSWYQLWDSVTEPVFLANAASATALLQPVAVANKRKLRVVLDDGWQVAWGDWRAGSKFPSGLAKVAEKVGAGGAELGLWLAPLLVDAKLPIAQQHPDWFVKDVVYAHLMHGDMKVLDVTQPDARAYRTQELKDLRAQGVTLFKIDFLFAATWTGQRHAQVTGMQAYHLALQAIRSAVGEDAVLLAVGAPPLGTVGMADAWRYGPDIALQPFGAQFLFLPSELRTLSVRWPYCKAILCDADPAILRDMSAEEVGFGAGTVMATGGGWWLSDDLTVLPAERRAWGATPAWGAAALSGTPAVPEPLFAPSAGAQLGGALKDYLTKKSTQDMPVLWRLPNGARLAFNPRDTEAQVGATSVPAHGVRVLTK